METNKTFRIVNEAALWATLLLPLLHLLWLIPQLPAQVPVHFNINGEPDRWGSPYTFMILPVINLPTFLLIKYLPLLQQMSDSPPISFRQHNTTRWALQLFLLLLHFIIINSMLNPTDTIASVKYIFMAVALLFIVLGNGMHSIQPNLVYGIRLGWTLNNPEVWRRTHQTASKWWVGISMMWLAVAALAPAEGMIQILIFAFFVSIILGICIYIPWYYNREVQREKLT